MRYAFPCDIVLDEEERVATGREAYVVTFPDVSEANTGGWSWEEALYMAEDCLGVALGFYVDSNKDLPIPSPLKECQVLIPVPVFVAAKLTIYTAMREQGITNADLAGQAWNAGRRRSQTFGYNVPLPPEPPGEGTQSGRQIHGG